MLIIGDIHGHVDGYLDLIKKANYSVQIGDFGFNYNCLNGIDCLRHKFFSGNHDNYDKLINSPPHYLGKYGYYTGMDSPFFWISGAWSIDFAWRQQYNNTHAHKIWWAEEELSQQELTNAIKFYEIILPDLVLSHTCPQSIQKHVSNDNVLKEFGFSHDIKTKTSIALDVMFDIHQPKVWIFGHFHQFKDFTINGTQFICLNKYPDENWWCNVDNLEVKYDLG